MPSRRSWKEGGAVDDAGAEKRAADDAWAFLRGNSSAGVQFGEHLQDASYVLSHGGDLVLPVMAARMFGVAWHGQGVLT